MSSLNRLSMVVKHVWLLATVASVITAFHTAIADEPEPADTATRANAADESNKSGGEGVNVTCVGADGKSVAGAEVYFFQSVPGEPARYKQFGPFKSNDRGRATCPRAVVSDGRGHFDRWVYARVPGRLVGVARSANWKARTALNPEFRVELHPSRAVEGIVRVPNGFNPNDVTVRVRTLVIGLEFNSFPRYLPFAGLDTALPEIFDKRADATGHIRFDDMPARGSLFLATTGKGLAEAQWRNDDKTFDKPIEIDLVPEGVLTGRVVSPDGKPAARMKVAARLSSVSERILFLSTFRTETDASGQFALGGLPDTRFVLSVEDPSHQWSARPRERLSVTTGETKDVTVQMELPVTVSGRVFNPEGKPVEGAAVSALVDTEEGSGLAHDMTDREGRYRMRLPSGRARLYFNSLPSGFVYPDPQIIKRLDLLPGQESIEDLDFTIYRNADDARRPGRKKSGAPAIIRRVEPDPAVAKRVTAMARLYADRELQLGVDVQVAQYDKQKNREVHDRYFAAKRELAGDLMYLIAEHPTDPAALDGVLLLVGEMNWPLDDSLTEIVLDYHLADAGMGRLCFALRSRGGEAWAERILKAAAEKHPQRDVRGQAIFALGDYYRHASVPNGRELPDAAKASLVAQASRYYQQAIDEFAAVLTPDGKTALGEKARHELARFKNLPNLKIGRPAPPITGEALDGRPMSLADYRGQVVLLVFWGSWCGPCMRMVPHERELAERFHGKAFAIVGVNCGDVQEDAKATIARERMTWRCWWDGEETRGPIETDYDVSHWPRVFVIDAEGIIRSIDPEAEELGRTIERLQNRRSKISAK